jgi:phospholipid/cholesterol/gamma-HCH transport system ATP-binding protein
MSCAYLPAPSIPTNQVPALPTANIVEIRDLHFSYEGRKILNGINLTIPRGEAVAILGTGGSGKSTLLRLINGQLKPQRGRILVDGEDVHALDNDGLYRLRRKMGMMFQVSGLFSDLSVYENIAFPMREHTDLSERMIHDLVLMKLHAVGLRGAQTMMPRELSGGMQRRVALARAIALDPMLIMYDEPFAGLDPISLNVIAKLLRRLNDALGVSSIVVTYDVSESLKVVDRVCFLADGVIVAEGPTAEMLNSRDPFVHQFIHAEADGPVHFHYPARPLANDLGLHQSAT